MHGRTVLSEEADRTCRSLMIVAAEWERSGRYQFQDFGAGSCSPGISSSDFNLASLMQISRCVSLVEVYTFGGVLDKLDRHVSSTTDLMLKSLYKDRRRQLDGSWESVRKAALEWLGTDFRSMNKYPCIEGYVEARNSALHASGRVSKRQSNNLEELHRKLHIVDISIENATLIIKPGAVRRAAIDCREFVTVLDQRLSSL